MWQIIQLLIIAHILPPVGGNEEIERGARGSPAPDHDHDNYDDDIADDHWGLLKPFSLS